MKTQNTIYLSIKMLGKRRAVINKLPLLLPDKFYQDPTLKNFLHLVVTQQVEQFNAKADQESILPFLSPSELDEMSTHGKVTFGQLHNPEKANVEKAIETAIQAFEDGIYLVVIDGENKEDISEKIDLKDVAEVVFIRLTMLAGSIW